jgi:hypothetical protein
MLATSAKRLLPEGQEPALKDQRLAEPIRGKIDDWGLSVLRFAEI